MPKTEYNPEWQDGAAYELFMGRWSRLIGSLFVEWLHIGPRHRWLDVGCGTGAFTEVILSSCDPAAVVAIDPSERHIAYAKSHVRDRRVRFQVGDATSIDSRDDGFDVATAALVLNFIPNRAKAVAEMSRVVRPGGTVAAYVWDFAGRRNISQHLWDAIPAVIPDAGMATQTALQADSTRSEALVDLFRSAGLAQIGTTKLEATATFAGFEDYWNSNTGFSSPISKACRALSAAQLATMQGHLRATLPMEESGTIAFPIGASAVRGSLPGN